eukprot:TRINITY_DN36783_c0_g1_i3.p1 TRINITY_DN36783_c0_g1~~TRINITY_DN36783_c0_g1_i3.p1  ORF type:complete len:261 (-),score=22.84 TRINITY_DN36783_c0_g1_i3:28-810(-)
MSKLTMLGCVSMADWLAFLSSASTVHDETLPQSTSEEVMVIDSITHEEPPAIISPIDAAIFERVQWERAVGEHLAQPSQQGSVAEPSLETHVADFQSHGDQPSSSSRSEAGQMNEPIDYETIYIIKFTRNPKELEDVLHAGATLETVRNVIIKAGYSCRHSSGATIMVYPEHMEEVLQTLSKLDLRPFHVVVTKAWKPLLYEAVEQIRRRLSVRPREETTIAIASNADPLCFFAVEKTFIAGVAKGPSDDRCATRTVATV